MGCTICYISDRYPATIVKVNATGGTITIREDEAIAVSGSAQDGSVKYRYEENPQGSERVYTRRKNGSYVEKGGSMKNGTRLHIGSRDRYYDPHF
jgi:hypothetical protein